MQIIEDASLATLELSLRWKSAEAAHTERFLARRVQLGHDLFPWGFKEALLGRAQGAAVSLDYEAGSAVPPFEPADVLRLERRQFLARTVHGCRVEPKPGRFYPRGMISGVSGVYPQDVSPCRILAVDDERMVVDLNHPLARHDLTLSAVVREVRPAVSDPAGEPRAWMEELAANGPGLEARAGFPTDFSESYACLRQDGAPDAGFYARPRLVGHVDARADAHLKGAYGERLRPGMRVLDLMSGWQSHLPETADLTVTGLGLNAEEMAANPRLSGHLVHDLNAQPILSFPEASFEAVVLSLSVEYLTRPREVFAEAARVLAPGGVMLVGFSNRWFPPKVTALWTFLHEFERLGLVLDYLLGSGAFEELFTLSVRNWERPREDRQARDITISDPVYVVGGRRKG